MTPVQVPPETEKAERHEDLMKNPLSMTQSMRRRMARYQVSLRALLEQKIHLTAMEFYLVDTCNLRCQNCSASSQFMNEVNTPNLNDFVESLSFLSRVLRCEELRLLGGEPLLNKHICSFMRAARRSGMFRKLRVITNGLLLHRMTDEFWQLADIVRISVYPATAANLEPQLQIFR